MQDLSLQGNTDIAYGYRTVDLETLSEDRDLKHVLDYINNRYKELVADNNINKIEELKLFDGRINYKIFFHDSSKGSDFKFIVFYQPSIEKVMVLNSVNFPSHSQYNQLSSE